MKKIIVLISIMILSVLSFGNQKEVDMAQLRSNILKGAVGRLGNKYDMDRRTQPGYDDCSTYVNGVLTTIGLKGGVTGNSGAYGTTAQIRSSGMIKKGSYSDLKAGDIVNFSKGGQYDFGHVGIVVENLGNGKIKMAHASSSRGTVIETVDLRTYRSGTYSGYISADAVAKANGLVPTNTDVDPSTYQLSSEEIRDLAISSANNNNINYSVSLTLNWDELANEMGNIVRNGLSKIGKVSIFIISTLFFIQVLIDCIFAINTEDITKFLKDTLIRKTFGFVFYLMVLNMIYSGELVEMGKDLAYGILELILGTKYQSLDAIWQFKEVLGSEIFKAINSINWFTIKIGIPITLFFGLLVLYMFITMAFFFIMFDLLKLLIGFQLGVGLSALLIPLGVLDMTKEFYNVGKTFSMIINFIIKLVSINFFAVIGIKVLQESNTLTNLVQDSSSILAIIQGKPLAYACLIWVVYTIIHKMEISI